MKAYSAVIIFAIVLLSAGLVVAQPNFVATTVTPAATSVSVTIPENAVEVAPGIFSLGEAVVDGKKVQGFMFIDYKKGFGHKPQHNPPAGNGGSQCFAFLAKGAKWKTTEQYVLSTTNSDGLSEEFVASRTETSLNAWDNQVAFDIFGTRNSSATVDGANTESPDNKNEIFFGNITEPGVIASAIVWGIFIGPPSGREIVEYDVVFDDPDFTWGDAGTTNETSFGNTSVMDFQNIAAHEFGHSGGMSHPDDACTEETEYRFAQAGETKKRTLHTGDIAGITQLYS